ncbi:helix-turn-helix domain-containing protein [Streptomyces sp. NPDC007903]|uniref:helix-turn-helix domain-containing protein n=1 Tax=Streptomyces sp. NPDC007903 TaxID=3364786 RepID=UPI0036EFA389
MTNTRRSNRYLKGEARIRYAADLKRRYDAGATVRSLAAETGRSTGGVTELLYFAGTVMRPSGFQTKPAEQLPPAK